MNGGATVGAEYDDHDEGECADVPMQSVLQRRVSSIRERLDALRLALSASGCDTTTSPPETLPQHAVGLVGAGGAGACALDLLLRSSSHVHVRVVDGDMVTLGHLERWVQPL
jgi:hypothetical protein